MANLALPTGTSKANQFMSLLFNPYKKHGVKTTICHFMGGYVPNYFLARTSWSLC